MIRDYEVDEIISTVVLYESLSDYLRNLVFSEFWLSLDTEEDMVELRELIHDTRETYEDLIRLLEVER